MKFLRALNLCKSYRKRQVVRSLCMNVSQGEIVGLLGPNGAGKTTTFYMITGMIRPNGGQVCLNGSDLTDLPMYKRARQGVGYLPQEPVLDGSLDVSAQHVDVLADLGAVFLGDRAHALERRRHGALASQIADLDLAQRLLVTRCLDGTQGLDLERVKLVEHHRLLKRAGP